MAKYDKDFLIEIRPTLTKDAISSMKKEVEQVSETIRKNTKLTYDLDIKKESRIKLKELKNEIKEITGLAKISSKTDLGKVELDDKELEIATKKLNEYRALAKQSSSTRIDANYVQFEKVLKKVEELEATYKEIEKLDPSNAEDIKKGNALLEEYERTAQSIARLGYDKNAFATSLRQQLESQNMERQGTQGTSKITADLKQLTNEAVKSGKEVKDLDKEIKDLGLNNSVEKISTDVKETKKNFDGAAKSGRAMTESTKNPQGRRNIDNTQKSAENLVDSFKKMARWGVVAFAWRGITQQIREGIQYIKELDVVLTEIAVVTGKTREEIYELGREFNEMAKRLGRTTAEVSNASKIFFRQGKTTEEVMLLVEASTKAASVAHIELAEASDYLTSTLNGFQMEATQAMEVVDKFSAVGANAGTSFEEMAQALKKVASSANNANVDMDHMISYLATVSEVTREAPENIGTSFKTLFARMQKITRGDMPEELNKVDQALNSIGISLKDDAGQIKSLQFVVEDLGAQWTNLTKNQQAYLATSIAGTRQQVRFISLMDNYDRSLEILDTSINSAGEGQLQFNQYLDGFEASLKAAKAEVEALYLSLKETGVLEAAVEAFTRFVRVLNAMVNNSNTLASVISVTLIPALSLLAIKFVATGKAFAAMQAYRATGSIFVAMVPKIAALSSQLSAATVAASTTSVTFTGLSSTLAGTGASTTLLAGSLGTLLGAIGGVIAIGVGLTLFAKEAATHFSDMKRETKEAAQELGKFADESKNLRILKDTHEDLNEELDNGNLSYQERIDKEKELMDVNKKLGQLLPDIVTARNEEGEAIRNNIELIDQEITARRRELFAIMNESMNADSGFFGGLVEMIQQNPDTLAEYKAEMDEIEKKLLEIENRDFKGKAEVTTESRLRKRLADLKEAEETIRPDIDRSSVKILESEGLLGLNKEELTERMREDEELYQSLIDGFSKIVDEEITDLGSLVNYIGEQNLKFKVPQIISEKAYTDQVEEDIQEIKTSPDLRRQFQNLGDLTSEELRETFAKAIHGTDNSEVPQVVSNLIESMENELGTELEDVNLDDVESFVQDYMSKFGEMTESTGDFLSLSKNLNKTIEASLVGRRKLNEYMKEFNEEGQFSAETINKIVQEYPDLADKVEDQADLQELLNKKYKDTTESIRTEMKTRLFYNTAYTSDAKENFRSYVSGIAEDRNVDLENHKDLYQSKLDVINSFNKAVVKLYDSLTNAIRQEDIYSAEAEKRYMRSVENNPEFEQYAGLQAEIIRVKGEIEGIDIELPFFDETTKKKGSEVNDNLWDIVDAEIAWLKAQYDNLEAQDNLLKNSKAMVENIESRLALEKEKQDMMNKEIDLMDEGIEKLKLQEKLASSEGVSSVLLRKLATMFDEQIETMQEKRLEAEETIQEKLTELYEEQHQKRLDNENEEFEDFMEKNDKRLQAIRDRHKAEDYEKEIKDIRKDQSKLQDRINEYRLIGTESARKKILELEQEYLEKEEELEEKKLDKTREKEIEKIEKTRDAAQDAHEDRIDEIDKEHKEKVSAIEGEFDLAKIRTLDLQAITEEFGEKGKSAIQSIISEIDGMIIKYAEASSAIKDLQFQKNEYTSDYVGGGGDFYDMAKNKGDLKDYIANKRKWERANVSGEEKDPMWTERNQQLRDQYGIKEDSMSYSDMVDFFKDIFGYVPKFSSGGMSTSTQLAQIHGTKQKPEFIFNYDQMSALSDIMGTGGSGINIGSLVNVEGSINSENVDEVVGAVKSSIDRLKDAITKSGKITRISGNYI